MSDGRLDEVCEIVGHTHVLTGADGASALVDHRRSKTGDALAVVRPGDTGEVARVVRWCAGHGIAVVSQGGNTGLSAGATPVTSGDAIVLSLGRLDEIEEINASGFTMTVGAGTTIEQMQDAAADHNRLFAPDWGARGTATIGGAIATDAGGVNVVRYGNLREQVLGLEVVLADGRIWNGLRALRKDSSGYDLKQLFVGSEGTLGVITRAVVKLWPATHHSESALLALASLDALAETFSSFNDAVGDVLVSFELLPEVGFAELAAKRAMPHPSPTRAEFYVLVRLASGVSLDDRLTDVLARSAEAGLITDAVVATGHDREQQLWDYREQLPASGLFELQLDGLKMDTAVPIERVAEFYRGVEQIATELVPEAFVYGFGHVGDGNLHMYVMPRNQAQVSTVRSAMPELVTRTDQLTFDLGGTLSAEHGVGRNLRDRIGAQKSPIEWDLMRSIKSALDPNDLFNPGALFPSELPPN